MSEQTGPRESVIQLSKEPFLQADELVAVTMDLPDALLTEANLQSWLEAALLVQKRTGCSALSFNQLNPKLLHELGFGKSVPPSIIYTHHADRISPLLLINPWVSFSATTSTYPVLEGCGSIDHGHKGYVVSRKSSFSLRAHAYDGKTMSIIDAPDTLETRILYPNVLHEDIHLRHGQTALDAPELLWDITQRSIWQEFLRSGIFLDESSCIENLSRQSPHGIVVPNGSSSFRIVGLAEIGKY